MDKSFSSQTRSIFEHAFINLRRTLAEGTSRPKALKTFLREINVHQLLRDVSSLNLVEQICTLEVQVGSTFSIYYVSLCIILNDIRAAQKTEKEVNLNYAKERAQSSSIH